MLSADFPHMFLLRKFEEPFPCGYLETELKSTGDYFVFYAQSVLKYRA